jgi:HEAT repeat protein
MRRIGDKRAVDYLLRTVRHGDIRVKKEVIRTLGELGGASVLKALRDCLDDPEIQVRSASLKALANIASEATKRVIIDKISDKHFKNKVFNEKKEYFEVLSQWKDAEIYNLLIRTIKKKAFLGRSKNYENRACAAYCLGLIGKKDALPILNKYKNVGNKLLRESSNAAARKIENAK